MQERTFKQLLMSSNYYTLNKQIVKAFGVEAAFVLTILIEASDGLADEDGWFYQTIETLEELTGLSRHKQNKIIQDLIEAKILVQENRGTPCRRYFKISFQEIENLVFKKTETSLLKIDKLDCKNFTNCFVKNSQTSLSKIYNNKEYIINNLNKELNHKDHNNHESSFEKSENCDFENDLERLRDWFENNGINFTNKHKARCIELLKTNSVDFILNNCNKQIEILKKNPKVKSVIAVFCNHFFKGTCEIDIENVENLEEKQKQIKNNEKKEVKKNVEVLDIFQQLPLAEQEKIEADILKKIGNQEFFLKTKENNPGIFYSMISSKIREVLEKMNYIN